jgi:hypothetical protein
MFKVGDKVEKGGKQIWLITGVKPDRIWYDVIYENRVSPNTMSMKTWEENSIRYGWKKMLPESHLPEELFHV